MSTLCISQFRYSAQIRPSSVVTKDYTFKRPGWAGRFDQEGQHQDYQRTQYEVYDYPGRFKGAHGQNLRQANELENKLSDVRTQYYVQAREELAKANAEVETQRSVIRGREDSLTRLNFTAPVRGIVQDIDVTTVGGVIAPGGKLMTIVPLDEQLLIEAKISPRDVAFIHPGQKSLVKITAYDYSIYGGLPGEVAVISPDTVQDEVRRDVYYYRVYIRTFSNHLENKSKQQFPIFPGMVATVDIRTGKKSVLDYLLKPFNKAQEALRER